MIAILEAKKAGLLGKQHWLRNLLAGVIVAVVALPLAMGVEYRQSELSSTDRYFGKMGLQVRYFMPPNSVAPLAFYFLGDLLEDYTNLELIGTISAMETFQKIYRPEIYNANSAAGKCYQPSLKHRDYSLTRIVYDREERSQLAVKQGKFTEEHFIKPYKHILEQWASSCAL